MSRGYLPTSPETVLLTFIPAFSGGGGLCEGWGRGGEGRGSLESDLQKLVLSSAVFGNQVMPRPCPHIQAPPES